MVLLAMIPENPVVGGTVLRRAAIQSPNFVTGSTGWTINQDGSAEFNNLVIRNGQIVSGVALYYSSTPPALGNLVASVAALGGTDAAGNAYLPGVTSYFISGTCTAVSSAAGLITFFTAATAAGPWTQSVVISSASSGGGTSNSLTITPQGLVANALTTIIGALTVNGGLLTSIGGALIQSGLTWSGDASGDRLTLTRAGGAPLLEVDNTNNASTASIRIKTLLNAVQQVGLSILGTTDTNGRLTLNLDANSNPRISMGPGNASPDAIFFRDSPGLFSSDFIAHNNAGAAEGWNAVTFANGWANSGLEPGLQYRLVAAPDNCVQIVGTITVPVGFASGQNITTALPAAYRPAKSQELTVYNATTNAPARILVVIGGQIQYQAGGGAAGDTLVIPAGNLVALTA